MNRQDRQPRRYLRLSALLLAALLLRDRPTATLAFVRPALVGHRRPDAFATGRCVESVRPSSTRYQARHTGDDDSACNSYDNYVMAHPSRTTRPSSTSRFALPIRTPEAGTATDDAAPETGAPTIPGMAQFLTARLLQTLLAARPNGNDVESPVTSEEGPLKPSEGPLDNIARHASLSPPAPERRQSVTARSLAAAIAAENMTAVVVAATEVVGAAPSAPEQPDTVRTDDGTRASEAALLVADSMARAAGSEPAQVAGVAPTDVPHGAQETQSDAPSLLSKSTAAASPAPDARATDDTKDKTCTVSLKNDIRVETSRFPVKKPKSTVVTRAKDFRDAGPVVLDARNSSSWVYDSFVSGSFGDWLSNSGDSHDGEFSAGGVGDIDGQAYNVTVSKLEDVVVVHDEIRESLGLHTMEICQNGNTTSYTFDRDPCVSAELTVPVKASVEVPSLQRPNGESLSKNGTAQQVDCRVKEMPDRAVATIALNNMTLFAEKSTSGLVDVAEVSSQPNSDNSNFDSAVSANYTVDSAVSTVVGDLVGSNEASSSILSQLTEKVESIALHSSVLKFNGSIEKYSGSETIRGPTERGSYAADGVVNNTQTSQEPTLSSSLLEMDDKPLASDDKNFPVMKETVADLELTDTTCVDCLLNDDMTINAETVSADEVEMLSKPSHYELKPAPGIPGAGNVYLETIRALSTHPFSDDHEPLPTLDAHFVDGGEQFYDDVITDAPNTSPMDFNYVNDGIDVDQLDWRAFRAKLVLAEPIGTSEDKQSGKCTISSDSDDLDGIGSLYFDNEPKEPKMTGRFSQNLEHWAYECGEMVEPGTLILGGVEQSFGFGLRQQYFHKAIILVLEHQENIFTKGIIMNRPTDFELADDLNPGVKWRIWFGGDVQGLNSDKPDLVCIHSIAADEAKKASNHIMSNLYWTTFQNAKRLVKTGMATPDDFQIFCGYAGWGPGGLVEEVNRKYWYTVVSDSQTLTKELKQISSSDPRDAGLGTWYLLMNMVGKRETAQKFDGGFDDFMLKEWSLHHLLSDEGGGFAGQKSRLLTQDDKKSTFATKLTRSNSQNLISGHTLASLRRDNLVGSLFRASSNARSPFLLRDQELHKSIVLVLMDDDKLTVGAILNRPATESVDLHILPKNGGLCSSRTVTVPLRFGGQYTMNNEEPLLWFHYSERLRKARIGVPVGNGASGIWKCTAEQVNSAFSTGKATANDFLVVTGVSAWSKDGGTGGGMQAELESGNFEIVPLSKTEAVWNCLRSQQKLSSKTLHRNIAMANKAWSLATWDSDEISSMIDEHIDNPNSDDTHVYMSDVKVSELADEALMNWVATFLLGEPVRV